MPQPADSGLYDQYRPSPPDTVRAIAAYSANLVLLKVLDASNGMALYETCRRTAAMWGTTLSLWRAGWTRMAGCPSSRAAAGELHDPLLRPAEVSDAVELRTAARDIAR